MFLAYHHLAIVIGIGDKILGGWRSTHIPFCSPPETQQLNHARVHHQYGETPSRHGSSASAAIHPRLRNDAPPRVMLLDPCRLDGEDLHVALAILS